mmetsp:Transcript_15276/g.39374  ORF Transcript_15276/g.39374 Transcript_15276/m.39374 type:complete len:799 (+) Transcript_15276:114-2510(+)
MSHCGGDQSAGPRICDEGQHGLFLPLGFPHDGEQQWPIPLRAILYFLGLGWCFLGVAIISDIFMSAIEKITSQKKRVLNRRTNRYVTTTVWNATVANLTLMALGSSAPEILLNIIDILYEGFVVGELGPSTIVGSAAFNLLCITAVCVVAIPNGEVRYIKDTSVYIVTASFSLFAYLWVIIILQGTSEGEVEVWEGVVTFLYFPLLIVIAYMVDRGYCRPSEERKVLPSCLHEASKEELAKTEQKIRSRHADNISDEQVKMLMEAELSRPTSKLAYRGSRTCSKQRNPTQPDPLMQVVSAEGITSDDLLPDKKLKEAVCEFQYQKYAVMESIGTIHLPVIRTGDLTRPVVLKYSSREGTAKDGSDFVPVNGTLTFKAGETVQEITVEIIDDTAHENEEEFYLDLFLDESCPPGVSLNPDFSSMTVVIIDDDDPGMLSFEQEELHVIESSEDHMVNLVVQRKSGSSGKIGCSFSTEDDTAAAGTHFDGAEGTMEFEPSQVSAVVQVCIKGIKAARLKESKMFRVVLTSPFGGARFDKEGDGGAKQKICTLIIDQDATRTLPKRGVMGRLKEMIAEVDTEEWRNQFAEALYPAVEEDDPEARPGPKEWAFHLVCLPWKLFFALVPPASYMNGWPCFYCALGMIGAVTATIGDLAKLFGCVVCVAEETTAITFVALGTSLPDTFASMTAATMDEYADASIGNVTGSNSVNVFLGLGLPWMMAAIYWKSKGERFMVEAGSLAFSVSVFSSCAACCILLLYVRRRYLGGELGGPQHLKWASSIFLVTLWFIYIGLSAWYTYSR